MFFTMAFRYLWGRKLRTFLTTLAVVFGVLVIFGMNIILPTMMRAFQANVMAAAGMVDVNVTHKTGEAFDASLVDVVKKVEGVQAVAGMLARPMNMPPDFFDGDPAQADRVTVLTLVGLEPEQAQTLHTYVVLQGRFLQDGEMAAAVITQSLADDLGLGLGDALRLPSTRGVTELNIVGILPPRMEPGNEEVLVTLPQAQAITGQAGKINTIEVNFLTMDEAQREAHKRAVEAAVGADYQTGMVTSGSDLYASLQLGQAAFNLFGFLSLFMGGFIIFNTFRTIVAERRRDIGMLRAIGASRRAITGLILVEGLLQGVLGSALGLAGGYLLGAGILKIAEGPMNEFVHLQVGAPVVSVKLLVTSAVLGVAVTVLAGLIPAVQANRVSPLEALRPAVAEVNVRRMAGAGFAAALALIGLAALALFTGDLGLITLGGLLFLAGLVLITPPLVRPIAALFGAIIGAAFARQGIGQMAEGNLSRQPSRAAITTSTTMIGLAIIVAMGGFMSSMFGSLFEMTRKSLGSDYLFIPPTIALWNIDIGANTSLADRLRQVDGVAVVSTLRYAGSKVGDQSVSILGIDPVAYPQVSGMIFSQGDESAFQELARSRALIVNSAFLTATGAKLGDTVQLATINGEQPYKIVGVATEIMNAKVTTAFISQANLLTDFDKAEDVFIQLNLAPGADRARVEEQIRAIARDYPQFRMLNGQVYYDQLARQINAAFIGLYFMLAFLALPSLIAMLNTLAIGVIERTREIGMLRAVGSTRRQIYNLVVLEALLLAALGTAFGLLGGMYLGYVMVHGIAVIFPLEYTFPLAGMLVGIATGLLFGVLAALIPARQASNLEIIQALRYE